MCEYGCLVPPFLVEEDIDTTTFISDKEIQMGKAILDMLCDEKILSEYSAKGLIRCIDFDNTNYGNKWIRIFDELEKR